MTEKSNERTPLILPALLSALITICISVAVLGSTSIKEKLSIAVFSEYKIAELQRDVRIEKDIDEINQKLDRLIELRISETK